MHVSMIRHRVAAIVAALYVLYGTPGALAQTQATRPTAVEETPPQVHALLKLLDDPAVRQWLERQRAADSATFPAAAPPPAAATTPIAAADNMVLDYFVTRITAIRHHIGELVATLPDLTTDFDRAFLILYLEFRDRGLIELLLLVAAFAALGFGTEWLFVRLTAPARARIGELPLGRVSERLRAMVMRLAFTVGQLTVFAIGSIGAFLVFDWPPLLRKIVLGYLVAFLAFRIALVTGRFVLAPPDKLFRGNERFRILPMTREAAWFWDRRLALLVGWFVFGWVTVELLSTLGFAPAARKLVAYALGVGLLVFGIEIAWRRPAFATSTETAAAAPRTVWGAWLLTAYFVVLWLLWVAGAIPLLWLSIVAAALPAAMRMMQRAINHILRPPGAADAVETPGVLTVCLERGTRVVLIIGAGLLLAWAWHIDLVGMANQDLLATRLLRGALNIVVIALVADFAWHVVKALIDRKLTETHDAALPDTAEGRRRARLRTLLPILSQHAVRHALSRDRADGALRDGDRDRAADRRRRRGRRRHRLRRADPGQGHHQRHVLPARRRLPGRRVHPERQLQGHRRSLLSLRSVKLRHHRGPLYTVPFGVLGAIAEHEPRLGDRQAADRRHLRHRPRQGAEADQADRPGACRGSRSSRRTSSRR